jgi:hypothetical protein
MNSRKIRITLLAWFVMIGFDFFIHGGLFARLYERDSAFLLPLADAFQLIPVGYASFLLLAILLVWLMVRLDVKGTATGLVFGLKLGALTWGAMVLGLLSISTADVDLMAAWMIGQTAELGVSGSVAGAALGGMRLRTAFLRAILFVGVMVVVTVVFQNLS